MIYYNSTSVPCPHYVRKYIELNESFQMNRWKVTNTLWHRKKHMWEGFQMFLRYYIRRTETIFLREIYGVDLTLTPRCVICPREIWCYLSTFVLYYLTNLHYRFEQCEIFPRLYDIDRHVIYKQINITFRLTKFDKTL